MKSPVACLLLVAVLLQESHSQGTSVKITHLSTFHFPKSYDADSNPVYADVGQPLMPKASDLAYYSTDKVLVVLAKNSYTLRILDISDPTSISELEIVSHPNNFGVYKKMASCGDYLVIGDTINGLVVYRYNQGSKTVTHLVDHTLGGEMTSLVFTSDCTTALTAYLGSERKTIVKKFTFAGGDLSATPTETEITFTSFDSQYDALKDQALRLTYPDGAASKLSDDVLVTQITLTPDGSKAYLLLDSYNGYAVVDVATAVVASINPMGYRNFNTLTYGMDSSDQDGVKKVSRRRIFGQKQYRDTFTFEINGVPYMVTADGGARFISELMRGKEVANGGVELSTVLTNNVGLMEALNDDTILGRIYIDVRYRKDGDNKLRYLTTPGSRSITLYSMGSTLTEVFSSGKQIEKYIVETYPEVFNFNVMASKESVIQDITDYTSTSYGPGPNVVTSGEIDGRRYFFVLSDQGAILVFSMPSSDPNSVRYDHVIWFGDPRRSLQRNYREGNLINLRPTCAKFVAAADSPNGKDMLITAASRSGSVSLFQLDPGYVIEPTPTTTGHLTSNTFFKVYADGTRVRIKMKTAKWRTQTEVIYPEGTRVIGVELIIPGSTNRKNYGMVAYLNNQYRSSVFTWRCTTESQTTDAWMYSSFRHVNWPTPKVVAINSNNGIFKKAENIPENARWIWEDSNKVLVANDIVYCRTVLPAV